MTTTVTVPNVAGAETVTGPWVFNDLVVPTRTRRIFLPANILVQSNGTAMAITTLGTFPDSWSEWPMVTAPAAAPQALYCGLDVPQDYSSGGTFRVVYSQSTASAVQWRARIRYASLADAGDPTLAASVVEASITPVATINRVQVATIGTVVATLTVGNWLRLNFDRDSAHADDTNAGEIRIIALVLEYTGRY